MNSKLGIVVASAATAFALTGCYVVPVVDHQGTVQYEAASGKPVEWSIECPAINGLARVGWNSKSLKTGDRITAYVHPLRTGGPGGSLADVTLANGERLGQTQIQASRDQSGAR